MPTPAMIIALPLMLIAFDSSLLRVDQIREVERRAVLGDELRLSGSDNTRGSR